MTSVAMRLVVWHTRRNGDTRLWHGGTPRVVLDRQGISWDRTGWRHKYNTVSDRWRSRDDRAIVWFDRRMPAALPPGP
jgi:hypothetical protein